MKTSNYLIALAALTSLTLVGCSDNDFLGDGPGGTFAGSSSNGELSFSIGSGKTTRAEVTGEDAAIRLGEQFTVYGWKDANTNSDVADNTLNDVFQDYLVKWNGTASMNTSETNTRGWEYVGYTSVPSPNQDGVTAAAWDQVIHYWDYSTHRYDFIAWNIKNTATSSSAAQLIRRNQVADGTTTKKANPELEFYAPTAKDLAGIYVSDKFTSIPEYETATPADDEWTGDFVGLANVSTHEYMANHRGVYNQSGKAGAPNTDEGVVNLLFRNLAAKVRIGIFETIPGYTVSDIVFYNAADADDNDGLTNKGNKDYSLKWAVTDDNNDYKSNQDYATLFGTDFTRRANVVVKYHDSKYNAYSPASDDIIQEKDNVAYSTVVDPETKPYFSFGLLTNERGTTKEIVRTNPDAEPATVGEPIGTTSASATMSIGNDDQNLYTYVFPMETNSNALELKVNYLLTSIDGSKENIRVTGANATIPVEFSKWKSNYAYTYLFKISDNTNGYTGGGGVDPAGLYPITFNACVVNDEDGIQETITTINDKSITTYQNEQIVSANDQYRKADGEESTTNDKVYFTVEGASANTLLTLNTTAGATQNVWLYTAYAKDPKIITEEAVANYLANNIVLTDVTSLLKIDETEAPNLTGSQYSIKFGAGTVASFEPMCEYYVIKAKSGSDITYKVVKVVEGAKTNTYAITFGAGTSSIANNGSTTFTIANSAENTVGSVTGAAGAIRIFDSASTPKDVSDLFEITQTEAEGVYTYTIKSNAPAGTYKIKLDNAPDATLTVAAPAWTTATVYVEEGKTATNIIKDKSDGAVMAGITPVVTPQAGAVGKLIASETNSSGQTTLSPAAGSYGEFKVAYHGAEFTVQVEKYELSVAPAIINAGDAEGYKGATLTLVNKNGTGTKVNGVAINVTENASGLSSASLSTGTGDYSATAPITAAAATTVTPGITTFAYNNATCDVEVVNFSLEAGADKDGVKTIMLKKDGAALNNATFVVPAGAKVQGTTTDGLYKVTGTADTTYTIKYNYKGVTVADVDVTIPTPTPAP